MIIVASLVTLVELDAARNGRQSALDVVAGAVFTPIQSGATNVATAIGAVAHDLAHAGEFAAENAALREQARRLAAANAQLNAESAENHELRALLAMKQSRPEASIVADVVGYSPEAVGREITIDRGTRDGVHRDSVVVSGNGLVGHVVSAGPHEARVLLVIDPGSSVPAYLTRSRSWGIVTGTWLHAKMKYVDQNAQLQVGDVAVTGRGEVYPGGITIGRVREIDRKDNALYQTAVLDPAVDFHSLTRVLVFTVAQ